MIFRRLCSHGFRVIISFVAAKLSFHTGNQLKRIERFRDVVIGPDCQTQDFICILGFGSQHDDRVEMMFPDFSEKLISVHTRQHDIQDCHGQIFFLDTGQRIVSVIVF